MQMHLASWCRTCCATARYDAINTAWSKMPEDADVTAHLNSDEQYLPGALEGIAKALDANPHAEVALGTYIIVDAESRYICHRRPIMPHKWTSQTVCEIITCSCFHRAEAFRKHGIRFDSRWRAGALLRMSHSTATWSTPPRVSLCCRSCSPPPLP